MCFFCKHATEEMLYFCYITKVNAEMKAPIVSVLFLLCGSENTFIWVLILGIQEYTEFSFRFLNNACMSHITCDITQHTVFLYKRVKG